MLRKCIVNICVRKQAKSEYVDRPQLGIRCGGDIVLLVVFLIAHLLSSSTGNFFSPSTTFWTSRGRRCLPFYPPVHAFVFIARGVQHFPTFQIFMLVRSHRILLTHALAFPGRQLVSTTWVTNFVRLMASVVLRRCRLSDLLGFLACRKA